MRQGLPNRGFGTINRRLLLSSILLLAITEFTSLSGFFKEKIRKLYQIILKYYFLQLLAERELNKNDYN